MSELQNYENRIKNREVLDQHLPSAQGFTVLYDAEVSTKHTCSSSLFSEPSLNSNQVLGGIPGDGDTLGVAVLCGDSFLQLI